MGSAMGAEVEVLHADSLAGSDRGAATWYVVFSANEMVVIVGKGNPLDIREVSDLLRPQVRFVRINGEKDLATARTIEFVKRATAKEGKLELASKIIDSALIDPAKATTVPEAVAAVRDCNANAAVVYYSAAMAARNDVDILRFPDSVNLERRDPQCGHGARDRQNAKEATELVRFLVSAEAQAILQRTGQPPVVPALRKEPFRPRSTSAFPTEHDSKSRHGLQHPATHRDQTAPEITGAGDFFADGKTFKLPCEFLRVYSPSAEVRGHGPGQEVLQTEEGSGHYETRARRPLRDPAHVLGRPRYGDLLVGPAVRLRPAAGRDVAALPRPAPGSGGEPRGGYGLAAAAETARVQMTDRPLDGQP
jgi:ABC-type molybdate transport system substrate-binding protein